MDYYRIGKLGLGKIGDRDIFEWNITEVDLYGIKIKEIRLASKLGYNRGWDTNGGDITEVGLRLYFRIRCLLIFYLLATLQLPQLFVAVFERLI